MIIISRSVGTIIGETKLIVHSNPIINVLGSSLLCDKFKDTTSGNNDLAQKMILIPSTCLHVYGKDQRRAQV